MLRKFCSSLLSISLLTTIMFSSVDACTRVVYLGPQDRTLTARSMDWKTDIGTNLWVLPRGVERNGLAGENSIQWTSRYGSVVATAYDIATTDGLNEVGLNANLLWLPDSGYPAIDGEKPTLAISLWAQYMLDNFSTVEEAVTHFTDQKIVIVTDKMPGEERQAALHLSLSDASGDSAIMEYIGGELVIHHSRDYQVMTNQPTYDKQLAMSEYWREIGGTTMLPGTNRPADRFVRASFYINAVAQTEERHMATAAVFSVIRNVSVPFGISTPEAPHISSTRWRVVADHKDLIYYFESALTPNTFWLDLSALELSEGSSFLTLQLGPNQSRTFSGEVSSLLMEAAPFEFLGVQAKE